MNDDVMVHPAYAEYLATAPHLIERQIETDYQAWAEQPERKRSPESDYGSWWTLRGDNNYPQFPRWRVSWIEKTGELYAVELGQEKEHRYIVFGVVAYERIADFLMQGWADPDSAIFHNLEALFQQINDRGEAAERMDSETQDYFEYLDELRASDKTNMFAAPTYLRRDFDLSNEDACKVVKDWMNSFSERHPEVVNRGAG